MALEYMKRRDLPLYVYDRAAIPLLRRVCRVMTMADLRVAMSIDDG